MTANDPVARSGGTIEPGRLFLASAGGVTLWLILVFGWHFTWGRGVSLPTIFFMRQDFPALLIGIVGLILLAPLAGQGQWNPPAPRARIVVPIILLAGLWAWIGRDLVFHGYALSRDEEVAEFAAGYLRDGMIARPIPPDLLAYRRAIMPEFFSPFGADHIWASAYLPINSAIRALFWRLGDPGLSGPALLVMGLLASWRVALRLFPQRPDSVWVTMILLLLSAQLSVTAMTPYAMTGHFAFNMLWLALLLRGGAAGHGGAALLAILAGGLHQWHFPPIFMAPFLLWLLFQRRWAAAAFHAAVLAALVLLWAKYWPAFLLDHLGPAADVRPAAGVGDKVGSLVDRVFGKWQPLLNLSRLLAWSPLLMVPLALMGIARADLRAAWRGETAVLPLALGCIAICLLALAQGYGWGFRYAHGFIGGFALLAGYGWQRVGATSLRPMALAGGLAFLTGSFLTAEAHDYVEPYARADRMIHASTADVVLVDPRGGLFATDLVRGRDGNIGAPVVMNLGMLTQAQVEALCRTRDVALFDRGDFRPLGLPLARWSMGHTARLRIRMEQLGCGRRP